MTYPVISLTSSIVGISNGSAIVNVRVLLSIFNGKILYSFINFTGILSSIFGISLRDMSLLLSEASVFSFSSEIFMWGIFRVLLMILSISSSAR